MKSEEVSLIKSFRFKIVLYTFLSLIYTALTEGFFYFIIKTLGSFLKTDPYYITQEKTAILKKSMNTIGSQVNVIPPAQKEETIPYLGLYIFLAIVVGIILFVIYFLLLTNKFSAYLKEIVRGINNMATGDLTTRIRIKDEDEFAIIGKRLNAMADDIRLLIESERKNEKIKSDLITNVAHDLRTPLTSIIGYLDLTIRQPDLEEETRRKYIQVAYDKALRLESLIGDLFSYTKFSSGEMKLHMISINIVKLMEQMLDEFYPAFQEADLCCELTTDEESAMVMGDSDMLARAFSNLIGNAVKYGKYGKNIRIRIAQNEKEVSVSIINYGEVIPEGDLLYIFDRFYRVENSRNLDTGGSGLGLAIAKKAILMHDGIIRASSSMEGTIFEVTLKKEDPA
ncbi:MAG: HAMP domain-containing sensor histidine kinase [Acetivibrio sp.]